MQHVVNKSKQTCTKQASKFYILEVLRHVEAQHLIVTHDCWLKQRNKGQNNQQTLPFYSVLRPDTVTWFNSCVTIVTVGLKMLKLTDLFDSCFFDFVSIWWQHTGWFKLNSCFFCFSVISIPHAKKNSLCTYFFYKDSSRDMG